jgi:hypothetical protein
MKKILFVLSCIIVIFFFQSSAFCQQSGWLLHGTVTWSTGIPAVSVQVKIKQGLQEKAVVYTNTQGSYGFYGLVGIPSDYTLEFYFNNRLIKQVPPQYLRNLKRGDRFDVTLHR